MSDYITYTPISIWNPTGFDIDLGLPGGASFDPKYFVVYRDPSGSGHGSGGSVAGAVALIAGALALAYFWK